MCIKDKQVISNIRNHGCNRCHWGELTIVLLSRDKHWTRLHLPCDPGLPTGPLTPRLPLRPRAPFGPGSPGGPGRDFPGGPKQVEIISICNEEMIIFKRQYLLGLGYLEVLEFLSQKFLVHLCHPYPLKIFFTRFFTGTGYTTENHDVFGKAHTFVSSWSFQAWSSGESSGSNSALVPLRSCGMFYVI